jgi:hypothetical protein
MDGDFDGRRWEFLAARLAVFGEKYECDYWYRGFDDLRVRRFYHGRRKHEADYQIRAD